MFGLSAKSWIYSIKNDFSSLYKFQKENNPIKAAKKVEKKILPIDNNVSKASPPVAAKESKKKTINQKTSTKKAATTKVKKTQEAVVKKDSSKDSPLNTNLDANKEQVIADNKINQNFNNEESQNNTQEERAAI